MAEIWSYDELDSIVPGAEFGVCNRPPEGGVCEDQGRI